MSQPNRISRGGRIDRSTVVNFRFNGKSLTGFAGDTVASALLANNIRLVARSFKYHRPRGVMGRGPEEPNAILQIGKGATSVPNARATQTEIVEGLEVTSVNCWPSVTLDLGAVMGCFAPLIPAGFYYKTFMYPRKWWMTYEKYIRKAAGLGVAESQQDPDRYDKINAWCDILIVGGGPAGLAAAWSAARYGARIIVADENSEFGGGLLRAPSVETDNWLQGILADLKKNTEVQLFTRTTAVGYYDSNFLVLNERLTDHLSSKPENRARERMWRVRAKQVILATGAIERPLVFANNDLPGIMLASAVSEYINRFGVRPGKSAILFTNNDSAYMTALDLLDAGVRVTAVVDARTHVPSRVATTLRGLDINIITSSVITRARGKTKVSGAEVMTYDADSQSVQGTKSVMNCDLLVVSGGWSPAVHLQAQSGAKPVFQLENACFVAGEAVQDEQCIGAMNTNFDVNEAIQEGFKAGAIAAEDLGFGALPDPEKVDFEDHLGANIQIQPLWQVPAKGKRFVDYQNDTTADDIELAAREGYRSIEHVKRYTALGFGTDQGKLGNINGMAILANALDQELAATGTTTFRPLYTPVTFGAIAGREIGDQNFDPVRKTAMHDWHVRAGAEFENVGQWKRPWYYPKSGESMQDAINRECLAARNDVAVLDASTLGKIAVYGPDATEFLNRIYTNTWSNLTTGSCRYGLMLGEDGMIMDDGVSAKLGENYYYMTTTTGGAAHVLAWMERWQQTEWPWMKVYFTSLTDQWAVIAIAGPRARQLLERLTDNLDLSNETFPFMTFLETQIQGVEARIFRVSFSGELSYEINVPANYGLFIWEKVFEAGQDLGITPYGTETMHVLRAEKGFIIVGQDTDGSMTPVDMGMNWIVSKNKDCIGKRSLSRSDCLRENRKQLVGLLTEDPNKVLPEGAQLVEEPSEEYPVAMIGHVTSSYWSACLNRSIALAVVKGGRSRMGRRIYASLMDGESVVAEITSPVFYDPQGERQNV